MTIIHSTAIATIPTSQDELLQVLTARIKHAETKREKAMQSVKETVALAFRDEAEEEDKDSDEQRCCPTELSEQIDRDVEDCRTKIREKSKTIMDMEEMNPCGYFCYSTFGLNNTATPFSDQDRTIEKEQRELQTLENQLYSYQSRRKQFQHLLAEQDRSKHGYNDAMQQKVSLMKTLSPEVERQLTEFPRDSNWVHGILHPINRFHDPCSKRHTALRPM